MLQIQDVLGIRVKFCQKRNAYRTCFFGKKTPARQDGFTLLNVTGGRGEFNLRGRRFTIAGGDIVLWEPMAPCEFRSLPGRAFSYYIMVFEPVPAMEKGVQLSDLGLHPFYRMDRPHKMRRLFEKLVHTFCGKDRFRAQKCSILALQLLLALKPQTGFLPAPFQGPDDRPADERILDTLDYINMYYKKRLAVRTLAGKVMMHPVHFTHLFKRVTGLAPHQYVLEKKIEKAKDFLLFFGESCTTTALELGFHDYSHFYRVFRRLTGMSPLQFLKDSGRT